MVSPAGTGRGEDQGLETGSRHAPHALGLRVGQRDVDVGGTPRAQHLLMAPGADWACRGRGTSPWQASPTRAGLCSGTGDPPCKAVRGPRRSRRLDHEGSFGEPWRTLDALLAKASP